MAKKVLKNIAFPLIVLVLVILLYFLWRILDLPPEDELIKIAKDYFEKYGLITVFISSIIEGLLLVGFYYPGSLVIFLGVIFAGKDLVKVTQVLSVVSLGLFISYSVNFFLGKYGWYKLLLAFGLKESLKNVENKLKKYGLSVIFMSYWQPNLASLVATGSGILGFPFKIFFLYSLFGTILWNIFWCILIYFLGEAALSLIGMRYLFLMIFVWVIIRTWFKKENPVPLMIE